jgi:hypothetical protein
MLRSCRGCSTRASPQQTQRHWVRVAAQPGSRCSCCLACAAVATSRQAQQRGGCMHAAHLSWPPPPCPPPPGQTPHSCLRHKGHGMLSESLPAVREPRQLSDSRPESCDCQQRQRTGMQQAAAAAAAAAAAYMRNGTAAAAAYMHNGTAPAHDMEPWWYRLIAAGLHAGQCRQPVAAALQTCFAAGRPSCSKLASRSCAALGCAS